MCCVSKLCVCVCASCVEAAGGGGREKAGESAQPKTKNPTQRCREIFIIYTYL